MKAKRFFLYANPSKPETILEAARFARILQDRGCHVHMDHWLHLQIASGHVSALSDLNPDFQALLCFGGDGTILRVLPTAAQAQVPVLGINMGYTGFLLESEPSELLAHMDQLLLGDYAIESRRMLRCSLPDGQSFLAMNEVMIGRGQNPGSLLIDVRANEDLVYTIHGDGILVSSPTGTTGYALSAGGPVIHPDLFCLALVPVCSHIMHQRPVILPETSIIHLQARAGKDRMAQLCLDGQIVLDLPSGDIVSVQAAEVSAQFIRFSKQKFLIRLHAKQMEWSNHVYGGTE